MPSCKSAEFVHLLILTGLSTIRTLLSIEVADVTGTSSIDFNVQLSDCNGDCILSDKIVLEIRINTRNDAL